MAVQLARCRTTHQSMDAGCEAAARAPVVADACAPLNARSAAGERGQPAAATTAVTPPAPCSMIEGTLETNPSPSPSPSPNVPANADDNTVWWPTDPPVMPDNDGEHRPASLGSWLAHKPVLLQAPQCQPCLSAWAQGEAAPIGLNYARLPSHATLRRLPAPPRAQTACTCLPRHAPRPARCPSSSKTWSACQTAARCAPT